MKRVILVTTYVEVNGKSTNRGHAPSGCTLAVTTETPKAATAAAATALRITIIITIVLVFALYVATRGEDALTVNYMVVVWLHSFRGILMKTAKQPRRRC